MLITLSKNATFIKPYRTEQLTTIPYSTTRQMAGPDSSSVSTGTCNLEVRISVETDICHHGCAYTVLQTVQSRWSEVIRNKSRA